MARIGILPLGRSTFDVPFAGENLGRMLSALDRTGHEIAGSRDLLFDAASARAALAELQQAKPDLVLILQVTFTDAAMAVEIAQAFNAPLAIWAVPEPRLGGRLRLNSFCGLNLAAHALGLIGRDFGALHAAPDAEGIDASLADLLSGGLRAAALPLAEPAVDDCAQGAVDAFRGARIGRLGRHPDGFDTCRYDKDKLRQLAGVEIDELEIEDLFARARQVPAGETASLRAEAEAIVGGLDAVDQAQLARSLNLKGAIEQLRAENRYDAFAIRCWPETFTEYGGAVCGPVSMMGEKRVPCACEADVYGALTTLLLQHVADAPAFLVDLVDLDVTDDTGVVWHCGQAPVSMADPDFAPSATIHTNRKMPLLMEFPLKAGRVTFFRLSQARGRTFAVIGGGAMLKRPMAFTGTSGVVRFDGGAKNMLDAVLGNALEHHMALAYGDHRKMLRSAAHLLGLPILELSSE